MNAREQRGIVIAATVKLNRKGVEWVVPSQTVADRRYTVDPWKATCTCPDHKEAGYKCKHIHAVQFTIQREIATDGTITETKSVTFTEKKVYKQNWPAYNLAQTTEKTRLQSMLSELCRSVPEPEYAGTGRRSVPMSDRLFACAYKVYCGLSSRRFACDLRDAHGNGYLTRKLHPSKVCSIFCDPALTDALRNLIARSSLPLRSVETEFAVDSSGFSTSRFVRWYDHKYGVERRGHDWVKAHICVGIKTGIVTAVEIKDRDANDSPLLPPLVKATARGFKIGNVSADKGYLSAENVETIAEVGGTPFIAPKANTTGGVGGLFEKMFHFYTYNRDEFLKHYHKRSNVESTFSAVKRKFGDSVRARNDVAMVNEVLCKFLCNNLCCVILSQIELGIDATFWGQDSEPNAILPMARTE